MEQSNEVSVFAYRLSNDIQEFFITHAINFDSDDVTVYFHELTGDARVHYAGKDTKYGLPRYKFTAHGDLIDLTSNRQIGRLCLGEGDIWRFKITENGKEVEIVAPSRRMLPIDVEKNVVTALALGDLHAIPLPEVMERFGDRINRENYHRM